MVQLKYLLLLLLFCSMHLFYHVDFCSAGDMRRANGLIARYGFLLHEGGNLSISVYNLLMKVCTQL